ncbi:MAG: response regulator [Rhodocyclaceae bacterium]|nr:response regulator [Rhodocyclaceae bacterium]
MTNSATILVVDDDPFICELITDTLGAAYRVISHADAESALLNVRAERPDAILLDVELPASDGYETCRKLKADDATAGIPVVFVSAHDRIEDRLKGYEAGGEDYIVKPFDPQELTAKLTRLLETRSERLRLKDSADYAGRTAMTAMTSMGELGALLQALKKFNACTDFTALADAVVEGISFYDLHGVAQVRYPDGAVTRASHGAATPLEASVISRMAEMDRIVQFRTRLSITYEHLSILITDMPVEDADRCGRLRDHLAMLAESAEMRVQTIALGNESTRRGKAIAYAISEISQSLQDIDQSQRQSHVATGIAASAMTNRMEHAYVNARLGEQEEILLSRTVQEGIESILNAQSVSIDLQDRLTAVIQEMKSVLGSN